MQRINRKGFILTETLIVSVVLMISFIFVFTQFLNVFAQYQTFERYNNVDSLYAAKNVDTFLKEDNYNNVISALNTNIASGKPYYEFTTCDPSVFTFTSLCTMLIQDTGIAKALFTNYDITPLKAFDTYTNNFSHELKSYITYLTKDGFSEQTGVYRVILELDDGTFSTFAAINADELITKQQYRYKAGYINMAGGATNVITINKTMPATLTIQIWANAISMTNKILWSFAYSTSGPALYFSGTYNYIYYNAASYSITGATPLPTLNNWHHYTVIFNGTNSILYVDGQYKGAITYYNPSGSYLYIGKLNNSTSYNWEGSVKELKVWNRALTPLEIINSMNNVDIGTSGLLYYYKLSEGTGTTMYDYSGNDNDIANALASVTWGVDAEFSSWIDGIPADENMYAELETRTLYFVNGTWVTEDEL